MIQKKNQHNNIPIRPLMCKMYRMLNKYGLASPSLNKSFKSIMRDYKQSLIQELERITQEESLVELKTHEAEEIKDNDH